MQYSEKDIEDFNLLLSETAKKILNDPRAKALIEKHGMCSVYLGGIGIGVQISLTIPKD